jgi:hypothetical protein
MNLQKKETVSKEVDYQNTAVTEFYPKDCETA